MNLSSINHHSDTNSNGCFNSFCNGDPETLTSTTDTRNLNYVNTQLRHAMNHLSITERDQAYEDLHGVRQELEENDELIVRSLNQMEKEISKIKKKSAYLLAKELSKEFIQDYKFRLMFLRSSRFDAVAASEKFIKFFELKLELFGIEKLTMKIKISDMNEEDLFCLMSGKYQLLPYRDRSGRAVVCIFSRVPFPTKNVEAMLRSVWYHTMCVLEDEETQRSGIVLIYFLVGAQKRIDPSVLQFAKRAGNFGTALPVRTEGTHICFNESNFLIVPIAYMKGITSRVRTRLRFHEGSDSECQFSLMTYGIPLHAFPLTSKGAIKVDNHLRWIQRRRIIETDTINVTVYKSIELPSKFDVLLGRGRPIQNSPGNERLREIVKESFELYNNAGNGEKSNIADMIVKQIKKASGRFLKEDKINNCGWVEVSDDIAKLKVCALFRTIRKNECSPNSKNVMTNHDRKRVRY